MNHLTPQQSEILQMLQDAGTSGINSYGKAREVALQLPAVIEALQKHGYVIKTRRHKNRSVDYILLHTPQELKNAPQVIARPQGWSPETPEEPPAPVTLSIEEIETKIQALRDEYLHASHDTRRILIRRARALEIAREKLLKRQQIQAL